MPKYLIAIDLDGTLMRSGDVMSNYTKKILSAIEKEGHIVIIATGRPYRMAKHVYEQLALTTPMINFNGALTHLPGRRWTGERAYYVAIDHLKSVLNERDNYEADFVASEYRKKFFITQDSSKPIDTTLLGVDKILPDHQLDPSKITKPPHSLLIQTRASDKNLLAQEMNDYYKGELAINTWGGPRPILEITDKGLTKATALAHLLNEYKMDSNQLIAFGDETNDIHMFDLAGKSYAMKNANPLLLEHASHQTDFTNEEDGVARTLEKLFL